MWIIILGNPCDGFRYHGPFASSEQAMDAYEDSGEEWWLAVLAPHPDTKTKEDS